MNRVIVYRSPHDSIRREFLQSLRDDLESVGHNLEITDRESYSEISFEKCDYSAQPREVVQEIYERLRSRDLVKHADVIEQSEANGVLENFASGSNIELDKIQPELKICRTTHDFEVYEYAHLLQSVTSSPICRHIRALVYDVGQAQPALIGILGFAGTVYSLKARDSFFDWDKVDSRSEAKAIKDIGLKRIMQLSVCMAVEPYSYLLAGNLMSLLALSSPIQTEFSHKYNGDPLLALVTTAAFGNHAAIFNRLQRNKLTPNDKYIGDPRGKRPNEFYQPIGYTSDAAYFIASSRTKELARNLVGASRSSKRAVFQALNMCGLTQEVLSLNQKRLYVGHLHQNNITMLRHPREEIHTVLDFGPEVAVSYWRQNCLPKATGNTEKMQKFRDFRPSDIKLSQLLQAEGSLT